MLVTLRDQWVIILMYKVQDEQGRVVQSWVKIKSNPGLALIGLRTTGPSIIAH